MTEDEKDLGVCLVDIGGGTTDIAIFSEGAIRHTAVIPIAGDQVTNDIAMALRTPTPNAEEIKIKYACALGSLAQENETIKIPSVGDRSDRDFRRVTKEAGHAGSSGSDQEEDEKGSAVLPPVPSGCWGGDEKAPRPLKPAIEETLSAILRNMSIEDIPL